MASLKFCFLSLLFIIFAQTGLANVSKIIVAIVCLLLMNSFETDSQAKRNKTKLLDLNFDVLFIICEPYDSIRSLTTLTDASDFFLPVARHLFNRNYANRTSVELLDPGPQVIGLDTQIHDSIYTNNKNFIRNFGDLFTKLTIRYWTSNNSTEQMKKIAEMNDVINMYCADTLVELEIRSSELFDFGAMKNPFEKLEILSLNGNFTASVQKFNDLFPYLRQLSLIYIKSVDLNFIVNHYQHLERVHLDALHFKNSGCMSVEVFDEFLKKNPQIRSFTMKNNFKGLLQAVNELLPDLEHLELHKYNSYARLEDQEIVLFDNVKNFTIIQDYPPENIQFRNLVEFCTSGYLHYRQSWVDFVERNPNLQKLYVKVPLADDKLVEKLAAVASNLTNIFLRFGNHVSDESIFNLIRNNRKLKKMHLDANYIIPTFSSCHDYSFKLVAELLQEEFGNEFMITASVEELFMERLN